VTLSPVPLQPVENNNVTTNEEDSLVFQFAPDGIPQSFDGQDDFYEAEAFEVSGREISIAAWIRPDEFSSPPEGRIISQATGIQAEEHFIMLSTVFQNGQVRLRARFKIDGRTRTLHASRGTLEIDKWNHVAATFDGSTIKLFQDGLEVGRVLAEGTLTAGGNTPVWIGANPPAGVDRSFAGSISRLSVHRRTLTDMDIQSLSQESPTSQNEENAAPAEDDLDLELLPLQTPGETYSFDGINSYLDLGTLDIASEQVTIAGWIRATAFNNPPEGRIISKATGIQADQHYFMLSTAYHQGAVRLRARFKISGTTRTVVANSGSIVLNEWTHVATSFDGLTIRLFQDGNLVGSINAPGRIGRNDSVPVWIGANPPNAQERPFAGDIRDLQILPFSASDADIRSLMD